ncbi:hypothetical protein GQ42DRAFT_27680 [Ramicandelaber brevisporus]|nr:hypothetical protein GQ42DRAFT_27680 [Ramicandelaber brevisporus]
MDNPVKYLALSNNASSTRSNATGNQHDGGRQPMVSNHGSDNQQLDHELNNAKEAKLIIETFSGAPGQIFDDHVRAVIYQAKVANVYKSSFLEYLKRSFASNIIEELNTIRANSFEAAIVHLYQAYDPEVAREHFRTVIMADPDRYLSKTLPMAVKLMRRDLNVIQDTNHKNINTVLEKWIQSAPHCWFNEYLPITYTKFALGSIEYTLDSWYYIGIHSWADKTGHEAIRSAEEKQAQQSNKS